MADLSKLKGVIRNTDSEQKQKNPIYSSMMYWSQKSSSICDALIEELTDKPEDVIFDPFLGSGVTLLESVSDKHNRICYGTEINEAPVFAVNTLLQKHDIRQIKNAFSSFLTKISFLDEEYLTTCPHCGSKAQIIQTRFDVVNGKKILKEIIYHCGCKAKSKNPDCDDISLFNAPRATSYIKNNELLYNSKLAVYKGEKIRDIFTERNFYVLDQIIGLSQKDPEVEELTKYILLSMMHLCKITDTHSNSQWPLWTPKTDCVEKNVLIVFRKKVKKLFDALEYENKNYHYANKMVANGEKRFQIFLEGVQDISNNEIKDNSVDLIITDPPYLGQVAYSEYMQLYQSFLGFKINYKDEIVVSSSPLREKKEKEYFEMLREAFAICSSKLKTGHYMCMYFHDCNLPVWRQLIEMLQDVSLRFLTMVHVEKTKTLKNIISPKKSLNGDAILFFIKDDAVEKMSYAKENIDEIRANTISQAKSMLEKRGGHLTTPELYDDGLMEFIIHNGWLAKLSERYQSLVDLFDEFLIWNPETAEWSLPRN